MNRIIFVIVVFTILLIGCNENKIPSATPFTLSKEEREIYMQFTKKQERKYLRNLSPISVAKLYVQSQIDKNYGLEYALYTNRKEYIRWTEEEHQEIPELHRVRTEDLIKTYMNIDKGTFIRTSEYEGYIEYEPQSGVKLGFQMIQDEDGIWKVGFMPLQ